MPVVPPPSQASHHAGKPSRITSRPVVRLWCGWCGNVGEFQFWSSAVRSARYHVCDDAVTRDVTCEMVYTREEWASLMPSRVLVGGRIMVRHRDLNGDEIMIPAAVIQ